jgi:ferredoxin
MKKVWMEPGCISCGTCEFICKEVFEVTDISRVKENVDFEKFKEKIREAVKSCPVSVIKIKE